MNSLNLYSLLTVLLVTSSLYTQTFNITQSNAYKQFEIAKKELCDISSPQNDEELKHFDSKLQDLNFRLNHLRQLINAESQSYKERVKSFWEKQQDELTEFTKQMLEQE